MKGPGALGPTKPPRMSGAGGPGPHLPPRMSGAGGPRPHLHSRVLRLARASCRVLDFCSMCSAISSKAALISSYPFTRAFVASARADQRVSDMRLTVGRLLLESRLIKTFQRCVEAAKKGI